MGYYMGDYYRGDPGIGSFLFGALKKGVGLIPGVGPLASSALSMIKRPGGVAATGGAIIKAGKGIIMKHPVLTAAGAAGVAVAAGAAGERMISGAGHRKCKHILPSGKCRRRMNVCNPKALRRSIRRTHGFAKLAMRTIHLVHPKKKARFGGFKKRKSHK